MANRDLPNVYTTLNDMSALIEGDESLICGITLRANRGPVGEAYNVQDSSDFLTRYTFSGKPGVKQDSTYFDIIELLKASRNIYVSRAANNPLYGGLIVKKEVELGNFKGVTGSGDGNFKTVLVEGDISAKVKANDYIRFEKGALEEDDQKHFYVTEVEAASGNTKLTVSESFAKAYTEEEVSGKVYNCVAPMPITAIKVAEAFSDVDTNKKTIKVAGRVKKANTGDRVKIGDNFYTIELLKYDAETAKTTITFKEDVEALLDLVTTPSVEADPENGVKAQEASATPIKLDSMATPRQYAFEADELFLITGIDQGAYNSSIGIEIQSCNDYELVEPNSFKIIVNNLESGADLEEYLVSMSLTQKSTDGTNMHIKDIVNPMSEYIQIYTPEDDKISEDAVPASTEDYEALGGGYDGDEIDIADNIAALQVFVDKAVPVSILVNGNNENALYQAAMIAICESRLDCFAFLRTPRAYEQLILPTQRVKQLINYKKNTLASNAVSATTTARSTAFKPHFKSLGSSTVSTGADSYLAAIYGPHVTVTDLYNSRKVTIGAESIAAKQWLSVINDEGFPYAAAGPRLGTIRNATVEWKIGDESSEARQFNDASMNMLVYEARQKYYYFNTQNTLQLANSAFRNIGAVLNVLNIKETLARQLKDYIQLPISDDLQEAVTRTICDYMDGCKSSNRVSDYALNNETTKVDISNNELHFMLTLAPAYYAQKIYLVVNVVNAAFDFQILQSL